MRWGASTGSPARRPATVPHRGPRNPEDRPRRIWFGVVVIEMKAVVEVPGSDAGWPWPVASVPAGAWLALDAGCTPEEVGLFVATLAHPLDVEPAAGREEVVATLLAEECLVVPGGLRLLDTHTGTAVVPGCCSGLEDWREWTQVLTGGSVWLGHDPGPEVEVVAGELHVWQDGASKGRHDRRPELVVPLVVLPDLLRTVQQDLSGFLTLLAAWTTRIGSGASGSALVEAVDRDFAVTAPWELPAG